MRGHGFFTNVSWADLLQHDSFYIPIQAHSSQNAPTSPIVSPVASPPALRRPPSSAKPPRGPRRAKRSPMALNRSRTASTARRAVRRIRGRGRAGGHGPAQQRPRRGAPRGHPSRRNVAGHVDDGDGGSTSVEERGLDSFDMSDDAMFNGAHGSLLLAGSHLSPLYRTIVSRTMTLGPAMTRPCAAARSAPQMAPRWRARRRAPRGFAQSLPNHQLPNFDYANVSNLMRINAVAEQNVGSVSNHEACKVCKYHLGQLNSATWADEDDFGEGVAFVDVRLHAEAGRDTELTFRENVVRISQRSVEVNGGADEFGTSDTDSAGGSSLASAAPTAHRAHHPQAEYEGGSDFIEIWFKNECRLVSGLTLWGAYTYGRQERPRGAVRAGCRRR